MNSELIQILQEDTFAQVQEILILLLEEASSDALPNKEEIAQWREILSSRGSKFSKLTQLCESYL